MQTEEEIRDNAEMDDMQPQDEAMSFSNALDLLKQGAKLIRRGWPEEAVFIRITVPKEEESMSIPYLYKNTVKMEGEGLKGAFPWTPTHDDLLAEDWVIVV